MSALKVPAPIAIAQAEHEWRQRQQSATHPARDYLLDFAQYTWPGYQRAPHLERIAAALEAVERGELDRVMIFAPPRHGKALADDTPMLTPDGWCLHGDLRPGDLVYGPTGDPTPVVATSGSYDAPIHRVRFSDGNSIDAHANHEWIVRADRDCRCTTPRAHRHEERRQTANLLSGYHRRAPSIPVAPPVAGSPQLLPIEPYVLGLWLGDGSSRLAYIHCGEQDIEHMARYGKVKRHGNGALTVLPPGLQTRLRLTGLLQNKHIPEVYFRVGIAERFALLQGLMDSDGYISRAGQCEYTTILKGLGDQVRWLIESLGMKATLHENRAALYGKDCGSRYRVLFYPRGETMPFRLPRKRERVLSQDRRTTTIGHRYIRTVEAADEGSVQSIQVAGARYLAGTGLIETCNSEIVSKRFPAWYLCRHPERQVISASYGDELAKEHGRAVRDIVADERTAQLFPAVTMTPDVRGAHLWRTTAGGRYMATTVGGAITGMGAHLLVIDDPIKSRAEANSQVYRDGLWYWYTAAARTRLEPGGAIVLMHCMTGDTPVLMADGREKALQDVRPGDCVATYDGQNLTTAQVLNWASQGFDATYVIRMKSGRLVRANERHPFLVIRSGDTRWVRLTDLMAGDEIVAVTHARERGRASSARTEGAGQMPESRGSACLTTASGDGPLGTDRRPLTQRLTARRIESKGMGWPEASTISCMRPRMGAALFAGEPAFLDAGVGGSPWITVTTQGASEACSATIAILSSATGVQKSGYCEPLPTFGIATDVIESITSFGVEEVFDIEVEGTENFIAGGLVSHNTRWSEDDLAGRLLDREAGRWHVITIPAIDDDGEACWPERYPLPVLEEIRRDISEREFAPQFQQRPAPEEGDIFRWYPRYHERPDRFEQIVVGLDTAYTETSGSDYTAWTAWGVSGGRAYWLEADRVRCEIPEAERRVTYAVSRLSQQHAHTPVKVLYRRRVAIDRVAAQHLRRGVATEPINGDRPQRWRLNVVPVPMPAGNTKAEMGRLVSPDFEGERALLPEYAPQLDDWIAEHKVFDHGAHDDWVETTIVALWYLFGPPKPAPLSREPIRYAGDLVRANGSIRR